MVSIVILSLVTCLSAKFSLAVDFLAFDYIMDSMCVSQSSVDQLLEEHCDSVECSRSVLDGLTACNTLFSCSGVLMDSSGQCYVCSSMSDVTCLGDDVVLDHYRKQRCLVQNGAPVSVAASTSTVSASTGANTGGTTLRTTSTGSQENTTNLSVTTVDSTFITLLEDTPSYTPTYTPMDSTTFMTVLSGKTKKTPKPKPTKATKTPKTPKTPKAPKTTTTP